MRVRATRVAEGARWVGVLNHHKGNKNKLLWAAVSPSLDPVCVCGVCRIMHHSSLPSDTIISGWPTVCQKVIYSRDAPVRF